MVLFYRLLGCFLLLGSLVSCARREQAFYQRTPHEPVSRLRIQPASPVNQSALDTTQAVAWSINETTEASIQSSVPITVATPAWRKVARAGRSVSEPVTRESSTHERSRQTRNALRKRIATDAPVQTSGLAVAALICGILSFLLLGVILGPLAIIFGGVALSKIRRNPEIKGRGLAVAGLILGIVATIVVLVVLAAR